MVLSGANVRSLAARRNNVETWYIEETYLTIDGSQRPIRFVPMISQRSEIAGNDSAVFARHVRRAGMSLALVWGGRMDVNAIRRINQLPRSTSVEWRVTAAPTGGGESNRC
jgi:hypothetical protein